MKRSTRWVVRSPVSGLLPWLPISLVTAPDVLGWAVALSLAFSVAILAGTFWVKDPIKNLEILDVMFFSGAAVAFLIASADGVNMMSRWIVETSTTVIFIYSLGSVLVRRPFTAQYSQLLVPPGGSDSPDFLRTNLILSGVWSAVFGVQLACLIISKAVIGDANDLIFAWILPIGALVAGFICNAVMTRRLILRQTAIGPGSQQSR